MKHDGLSFTRNRRLGYRNSNPDIDVDLHGNPVQSNYVAIVRLKDCNIYDKDCFRYYDATDVPSIPISYGGTYYGYGKWKKRKSSYGKWIESEFVHEYYQCTVYLVKGGIVYTTSIYRTKLPMK